MNDEKLRLLLKAASAFLVISLVFVLRVPMDASAHWLFLLEATAVLSVAYLSFIKKYYHLHEAYLASLKK